MDVVDFTFQEDRNDDGIFYRSMFRPLSKAEATCCLSRRIKLVQQLHSHSFTVLLTLSAQRQRRKCDQYDSLYTPFTRSSWLDELAIC